MSNPFTNPYDIPAGQTWQTLLDEITLAYSERCQAIGVVAYTPVDGKDVQAALYWATFQGWLEGSCGLFVDHENGPLNGAGDAFLYFTLATWRAAATLNASGFRRSTNGGVSFLYGQMQEGDDIGPWIFEDLQKGFGALKWAGRQLLFPKSYSYSKSSGNIITYSDTSEGALADNLAAWSFPYTGADANVLMYERFDWGGTGYPPPNSCRALSLKIVSKAVVTVPTFRPCAIDFYEQAVSVGPASYDPFETSLVEGRMVLFETLAETSDAARISQYPPHNDEWPGQLCPAVFECFFIIQVISVELTKWNFTNA